MAVTYLGVTAGYITILFMRHIRTRRSPSIHQSDLTVMFTIPLDTARLRSELGYVPQRITYKPRGLWLSCGSDWIDFVRSQEMSKFDGDYIYRISVDRSRIAHLLTQNDVLRFHRSFATITHGGALIDWRRVAFDYDGIMICPYQRHLRDKLDWYGGWDVASACIWRWDAIIGIEDISGSETSQ